MLIVLLLLLVAASGMASNGTRPLPRGPDDGILLENDLLGFRVWGPPSQPTITLGRSDVWDRRWFSDRQPLITLSRIRELAMSSRASEVPTSGHKDAIYDNYDFPCPKPGMQIILETPFATKAEVWGGNQQLRAQQARPLGVDPDTLSSELGVGSRARFRPRVPGDKELAGDDQAPGSLSHLGV